MLVKARLGDVLALVRLGQPAPLEAWLAGTKMSRCEGARCARGEVDLVVSMLDGQWSSQWSIKVLTSSAVLKASNTYSGAS